jgi:16S rRNA (guanine527-N7)-methyltransferase
LLSVKTASSQIEDLISAGWQNPDFPLAPAQQQALAQYIELLNHWNRVHSLTAIESPEAQVAKHLIDALAAWPLIEAHFGRNPAIHIADIGCGMGVPGIVWAVVMPQSRFDLIERQQKKIAFLRHLVGRLGLADRVKVIAKDVRDLQPTSPFDLIVSRAFAALGDFVRLTWNLSGPHTKWAAMTGKVNKNHNLGDSESSLNKTLQHQEAVIEAIEKIQVPGLNADRHLVWVGRRP